MGFIIKKISIKAPHEVPGIHLQWQGSDAIDQGLYSEDGDHDV